MDILFLLKVITSFSLNTFCSSKFVSNILQFFVIIMDILSGVQYVIADPIQFSLEDSFQISNSFSFIDFNYMFLQQWLWVSSLNLFVSAAAIVLILSWCWTSCFYSQSLAVKNIFNGFGVFWFCMRLCLLVCWWCLYFRIKLDSLVLFL